MNEINLKTEISTGPAWKILEGIKFSAGDAPNWHCQRLEHSAFENIKHALMCIPNGVAIRMDGPITQILENELRALKVNCITVPSLETWHYNAIIIYRPNVPPKENV